jgi:hypothetical protein
MSDQPLLVYSFDGEGLEKSYENSAWRQPRA